MVDSNKRTVFFVSDRTAITAEVVGHSLLSTYEGIFENQVVSFVDALEKAKEVVSRIKEISADTKTVEPFVFLTTRDEEIASIIKSSPAIVIDIFQLLNDSVKSGLAKSKRESWNVSISFAGENRSIAEELASGLVKEGVTVFYDAFEKDKLLGKDLIQYLHEVYSIKSQYCIVIISAEYKEKRWTKHELKAIQKRMFEDGNKEYLLPLRIDDTELPGLPHQLGYLDLRVISIEEALRVIVSKIKQSNFV